MTLASTVGQLSITDSRFGDFLEETAPREFERVHSEHPGYTNDQIISTATENMMLDIDDVDAAWSEIPPAHRTSGADNTRIRRADIAHFIERYMLTKF